MRSRILLSAVTAAAALGLAATPAAAQQGRVVSHRTPRVLATYDFGTKQRAIAFPTTVTVADSAGQLIARVAVPGATEELPMTVTVIDTDLVLQGDTPDGVLTLVLDRQNEGGRARVATGRWSLGRAEGQLRGDARS